ncbi:MAG TPA: hypothetical protein PKE69_01100 [Pyrinomonadaceae bacterium]|nr:hypothetical protein [Pyrinomonadaceae bacterium]
MSSNAERTWQTASEAIAVFALISLQVDKRSKYFASLIFAPTEVGTQN